MDDQDVVLLAFLIRFRKIQLIQVMCKYVKSFAINFYMDVLKNHLTKSFSDVWEVFLECRCFHASFALQYSM